jgi:hypothetical protein
MPDAPSGPDDRRRGKGLRRMRDAHRNSQRERRMKVTGVQTDGYMPIDKAKAEELLATATQLQGMFWDARSDLEGALDGIEISGTRDLGETTIDGLMEEAAEDGDDSAVAKIEP